MFPFPLLLLLLLPLPFFPFLLIVNILSQMRCLTAVVLVIAELWPIRLETTRRFHGGGQGREEGARVQTNQKNNNNSAQSFRQRWLEREGCQSWRDPSMLSGRFASSQVWLIAEFDGDGNASRRLGSTDRPAGTDGTRNDGAGPLRRCPSVRHSQSLSRMSEPGALSYSLVSN